ncbi:MAG: hypothetical protein QG652_107 [Pseudomonadota bacterium]|nr:hypothetical protein [Pseudomonadota bacterium]
MPRLSSGRHVGASADNIKQLLTHENDETVYGFIVMYRLNVTRPEQLAAYLVVVEFPERDGKPVLEKGKPTGFIVEEVLAGKAGWPAQDVAEFRTWLDEKLKFQLQNAWEEINQMITRHPVWGSELLADEDDNFK